MRTETIKVELVVPALIRAGYGLFTATHPSNLALNVDVPCCVPLLLTGYRLKNRCNRYDGHRRCSEIDVSYIFQGERRSCFHACVQAVASGHLQLAIVI